jgi:hypothetical protein
VITEEELSSRIRTIVEKVQADYSNESDTKRHVDALKGHFEVAGRELILDVAVCVLVAWGVTEVGVLSQHNVLLQESEIAVNTSDRNAKWLLIAKLYDACDIIRILFTLASSKSPQHLRPTSNVAHCEFDIATFIPVAESSTSKPPPKWDPVVMFMSIIDELVELLSIDSWNVFLGYFESRQEELTSVRSIPLPVRSNGIDIFYCPIGQTSSRRQSTLFSQTAQQPSTDHCEVKLRPSINHIRNLRRVPGIRGAVELSIISIGIG